MRKLRLKLPRSHSLSNKELEFSPQNYAYNYDTWHIIEEGTSKSVNAQADLPEPEAEE